MSIQKEKDKERDKAMQLLDGNSGITTSTILDQEDNQRKELVANMVETSTPATAPIVKCVTNIQGILNRNLIYIYIYIYIYSTP